MTRTRTRVIRRITPNIRGATRVVTERAEIRAPRYLAVVKRTLAIDIGINGLGCALYVTDRGSSELVIAWYSDVVHAIGDNAPAKWARVADSVSWLAPDLVVIETMKVYAGRAGLEANPEDLLDLQAVAGALAYLFRDRDVRSVLAGEWKGQVPKRVMTARIESWIDARGWRDRLELPKRKLAHNVYDAVGIGMVYLGLEGRLTGKAATLRGQVAE